MKKAHLVDSSYGHSLHEISNKFADKALFFSVTLWMCHLIGIQAGTVVLLGLEFNIKYPFLVYGILGLIVLNYCAQSLNNAIEGFALIDTRVNDNVSRLFLKISKSMLGDNHQVRSQKNLARLFIIFHNCIEVPWALIFLIILVSSFFLALLDVSLMIYGFYLYPPNELIHFPSRP
tara:strand:- start:49 stop:576 length:528 start_codon:yes stop_codon:yes gene_type:complete